LRWSAFLTGCTACAAWSGPKQAGDTGSRTHQLYALLVKVEPRGRQVHAAPGAVLHPAPWPQVGTYMLTSHLSCTLPSQVKAYRQCALPADVCNSDRPRSWRGRSGGSMLGKSATNSTRILSTGFHHHLLSSACCIWPHSTACMRARTAGAAAPRARTAAAGARAARRSARPPPAGTRSAGAATRACRPGASASAPSPSAAAAAARAAQAVRAPALRAAALPRSAAEEHC